MGKVLFLLLLAVVAYLLWRAVRPRQAMSESSRDAGRMVGCRHCGVYLPAADALRDRDEYYCCADHRDAMRD